MNGGLPRAIRVLDSHVGICDRGQAVEVVRWVIVLLLLLL